MTQEQLQDIINRLEAWRKERHLTIEGQQKGLLGNVLEEFTELARAQSIEEKIDALCDVSVFYLNSGGEVPVLNCNILAKYPSDKVLIVSLCSSIFGADSYVPSSNAINKINATLKDWGYDYYLCMDETLKEIESRTGKYDEKIGKFVKDTSPEAKAKWYKADYTKCKIEEQK